MISSDSFVLIQGWMLTDLGLKGTDLLVYAIIYSFSQDPSSSFTGSLSYLAEWTNTTKRTVINSLNYLLSRHLIYKDTKIVNGVKRCSYDYSASALHALRKG